MKVSYPPSGFFGYPNDRHSVTVRVIFVVLVFARNNQNIIDDYHFFVGTRLEIFVSKCLWLRRFGVAFYLVEEFLFVLNRTISSDEDKIVVE